MSSFHTPTLVLSQFFSSLWQQEHFCYCLTTSTYTGKHEDLNTTFVFYSCFFYLIVTQKLVMPKSVDGKRPGRNRDKTVDSSASSCEYSEVVQTECIAIAVEFQFCSLDFASQWHFKSHIQN